MYHNDGHMSNAFENHNASNVGRYALDRLIGDRTWTGTQDDMSVRLVSEMTYYVSSGTLNPTHSPPVWDGRAL